VVEDIPMNLALTIRLLADLGHHADKAANGRECLQLVQQQPYDLILMDLHMPVVDGITATREIRRREQVNGSSQRVYISALTANVMQRERDACLAAGMDNILAKPLQPEALRTLLGKIRRSA
jgi:CheY-like chemotaxis protein